jgi:hypothetical protein
MLKRIATIVSLLLIPLSALATPNGRASTTFEVVRITTKIHGSSSGDMFSYTSLMFTQFEGKRIVFECAQRGDICPVLESGKTYTAERDGNSIYIMMNSPELKKAVSARFRQVGSW